MLNLSATSLFDGTLAAFLVVFTLLLILITKNNISEFICIDEIENEIDYQ